MKNQNLFVIIVGLAAWIHSTWSFAVIIGGEVPALASPADLPRWLYWVLPGAAAAAAVDVGLISLAAQFRSGTGSRAKLVTFAVLSFISYLGQALFSLSHGGRYVPSLGLSGVSVTIASVVWEVLIWALPAALPVTLLLWAWSDMRVPDHAPTVSINADSGVPQIAEPLPPLVITAPDPFVLTCERCGKTFSKAALSDAKRALGTHQQLHCPVPRPVFSDNNHERQ